MIEMNECDEVMFDSYIDNYYLSNECAQQIKNMPIFIIKESISLTFHSNIFQHSGGIDIKPNAHIIFTDYNNYFDFHTFIDEHGFITIQKKFLIENKVIKMNDRHYHFDINQMEIKNSTMIIGKDAYVTIKELVVRDSYLEILGTSISVNRMILKGNSTIKYVSDDIRKLKQYTVFHEMIELFDTSKIIIDNIGYISIEMKTISVNDNSSLEINGQLPVITLGNIISNGNGKVKLFSNVNLKQSINIECKGMSTVQIENIAFIHPMNITTKDQCQLTVYNGLKGYPLKNSSITSFNQSVINISTIVLDPHDSIQSYGQSKLYLTNISIIRLDEKEYLFETFDESEMILNYFKNMERNTLSLNVYNKSIITIENEWNFSPY